MHQVVLGALVADGKVLLGHRSADKRANPGVWDLPGGVVEPGESELDALVRELHEELDVQISRGSAAHLCHAVIDTPDGSVRVGVWQVADWEGTPTNAAPHEHAAIAWVSRDDLPSFVHPAVRASVEAVLDAFTQA